MTEQTATRAAPDVAVADERTRISMYRRAVEIRVFEQCVYDLFMRNLVNSSTHLSIGQEAIATAFGEAMQPNDYTFATYRGHAHTLARGVPMEPVLAELMGRETGLMGGKGGSMHLTSVEHGMMGCYAIVGAHIPIACGAAWSAQYRGSKQVAVCFFGDGTTNIGAFHEAVNLAAVWKLPIVFVCENNLYMEYTSISTVTAVPRPAADRAAAYGLEAIDVDGNDTDVMYATASAALARARAGDGPSLIEARTYRHGGHSRGDDGKYRPAEEVELWLSRDPIKLYRERLLGSGVDEDVLSRIDQEVREAVEAAEAAATAAGPPPASSVLAQVWADGGSSWRN